MAILMLQDALVDTLAAYDTGIKQLEDAGHQHPPGRPFHVAVRKGTGDLDSDGRESQEALDRFFQILEPLLAQVGSTGGEPPEIYPIHNLIRGA